MALPYPGKLVPSSGNCSSSEKGPLHLQWELLWNSILKRICPERLVRLEKKTHPWNHFKHLGGNAPPSRCKYVFHLKRKKSFSVDTGLHRIWSQHSSFPTDWNHWLFYLLMFFELSTICCSLLEHAEFLCILQQFSLLWPFFLVLLSWRVPVELLLKSVFWCRSSMTWTTNFLISKRNNKTRVKHYSLNYSDPVTHTNVFAIDKHIRFWSPHFVFCPWTHTHTT